MGNFLVKYGKNERGGGNEGGEEKPWAQNTKRGIVMVKKE